MRQSTSDTALDLSGDFPRSPENHYKEEVLRFTVDAPLTGAFNELAQRHDATSFEALVAALNILLFRYTGQESIAIAIQASGSPDALRTALSGEANFGSVLAGVKNGLRDTSCAESQPEQYNVFAAWTSYESRQEAELGFCFCPSEGEELQVSIVYNAARFLRSRIQRMAGHLVNLLRGFISSQEPVSKLDLLAPEERKMLLGQKNTMPLPSFTTVQSWIEHQATLSPHAPAVSHQDVTLTYGELNSRANQLARFLITHHQVRHGNLVGVMVPRNEWMVITLLGILKAGAAYVPMDPNYPKDRVQFMLADSDADLIITEKEFFLSETSATQLDLENVRQQLHGFDSSDVVVEAGSEALAYIIYTSGSTGRPKGVAITHSNVLAFLAWAHVEFRDSLFETVFATTSYCFDLSVFEVFFSLSAGKHVRVLGSGLDIPNHCQQDKKILVNTVPSVVDALLQAGMRWENISVLNMAGEPISLHIKDALDLENIEVRNLYGPSEDTTYSSCYRLKRSDSMIPIGKPIANTTFYAVDAQLNLLPVGVPGEIAIAGAGLAQGYLNRPELTCAKFVQHAPFTEERLYLTGDIGVLREDGEYEYLGRKDNQVKIRGYRIELGEIENALLKHESIRQALVVARQQNDGEKYLTAYYIGEYTSAETLQLFLEKVVPAYMVPPHLVYLEKFPLTPNGKIDRKALPEPSTAPHAVEFVAPGNQTEALLAEIWKEVFHLDKVSVTDNFFALGGHSLKGVRILSRIAKDLQVTLSLHEIFTHQTICDLADNIHRHQAGGYSPIPNVMEDRYYDVSSTQRGLWIIDQMEDRPTAYIIPYLYRIDGKLDVQAFRRALLAMVSRHESLRTVFVDDAGIPRQQVLSVQACGFDCYVKDLRNEPEKERLAQEQIHADNFTAFDLSQGPLLRAGLLWMEDESFLFTLTIHHIVFDDWSAEVFIRELTTLYDAFVINLPDPLPGLSVQYKDYTAWQQQRAHGVMEQLRGYWLSVFGKNIPELNLPLDFERPAEKCYEGDQVNSIMPGVLADRLSVIGRERGASLFITLLAALKTLLYRYTGQEDIVIGTPVANRHHTDLHQQLGLYVNTVALRTTFKGQEDTFGDLIGSVKRVMLDAHQHQDYPFDQLVEALNLGVYPARSPLFDVLAVFQQQEPERDSSLKLTPMAVPTTGAKFDLEFYFSVKASGDLHLSLVYNTRLFRRERVEQMSLHFQHLLNEIAGQPNTALHALAGCESAGVVPEKRERQPVPAIGATHTYTPPQNETEAKLVNIWKEIFQADRIGVTDNFFALGGHSIKALQLKAKVAQVLGGDIRIKDVFKLNTIRLMAAHLAAAAVQNKPADSRRIKYAPIRPTEKKQYYPLSAVQRPLYMVQQIDPSSIAYNIVDIIPIGGEVDPYHVEAVVKTLIQKHEVFRTSFKTLNGIPYQFIADTIDFRMEFYTSEEKDTKSLIRNVVRPFDLSRAPLLRLVYVRGTLGPLFLIDIHHIISDAISIRSFYEDFDNALKGISKPLTLQYKDFSVWLDQSKKKSWMQEQQKFWFSQFEGEIPLLQLPTDYPRPRTKSYNGSAHQFILGKKATVPLQVFCRVHQTSLFTALLSAYYIFLMKMSGQHDIVVGVPSTFRNNNSLTTMMGMFVNTLPIRIRIDGNKSFSEFLQEVKKTFLKILDNQDYQLDDLISSLAISRDSSRSPLYDVMFNMLNQMEFDIDAGEIRSGSISQYDAIVSSQFDLVLQGIEAKQDIVFAFSYNTDLFKKETIERFSRYFENIILAIVRNPEQAIRDIDYIPREERRQLLSQYYIPSGDRIDATIVGMFEEQVRKFPGQVAVSCGGRSMTFAEVNARANALARELWEKGVKRNSFVPLLLQRSIDMPVALWGVLKCGCAFVPLAPEWPSARILEMLHDLGSTVIVTNTEDHLDALSGYDRIDPRQLTDDMEAESTRVASLQDPVYAIYTSGTTGKPKAAINLHRAMANRFAYLNRRYSPAQDDVMLLTNNYVFDGAVYQLLWPMTAGFRTVIPPVTDHFDLEQIIALIGAEKVSIADFVPSVLAVLTDLVEDNAALRQCLCSLRQVIVGGEAINGKVVYKLKAMLPDLSITNDYGPTETAISTIFYELPEVPAEVIPIGKPMDNVKAVITDAYGCLVPQQVAGELYLGGDCLGAGYLNKPELTSKSFVHLPIREFEGDTFYKTGDQVRLLPDGNFEFLGRIDHQVKIRGFRIEPEEIEAVIRQYPGVSGAVVAVRTEGQEKQLVAYFTGNVKEETLKEHLRSKLPEYMVPAHLIGLKAFPLLTTGKIDRRSLPQPDATPACHKAGPRNKIEATLQTIWTELLGKEDIGIHDDFFLTGGHSLKAIQLVHRIAREFGVDLKLKYVFEYPTIASIGGQLQVLQENHVAAQKQIRPVEAREAYPLSHAQRRLWFIEQFEERGQGIYNIPAIYPIGGRLDHEALQKALLEMIGRHESLRTAFTDWAGVPVQRVLPAEAVSLPLEFVDLSGKPQKEIGDYIAGEIYRSFNLAVAPLFRVKVVKRSEQEHTIVCTTHHIISDGWSAGIFLREMTMLYQAYSKHEHVTLPPLAIQYKDYAQWQKNILQGENLKAHEQYWLDQFVAPLPVLDLPADFKRPAVKTYHGSEVSATLDADIYQEIKSLSSQEGATPLMTMVALVNVLLNQYTGQEDIILGLPVAGRDHRDLENQIGLYVNTLALRTRFTSAHTFEHLVAHVKTMMLGAYEHQVYPFDRLIEKLNIPRDISRHPLFDVMVSHKMQTGGRPSGNTPGHLQSRVSKFDLSFEFVEGDDLTVNVVYNTDLFTASRVRGFLHHFIVLAKQLVTEPRRPLHEISVLAAEERHDLLFNQYLGDEFYTVDHTIAEMFDRAAVLYPGRVAAACAGAELTYEQLHGKANAFAHRLIHVYGVKKNALIPVLLNRGLEMPIALWGILKAGAAFVPLDPQWPAGRLADILSDTGASLLVTNLPALPELPSGIRICRVETERMPECEDNVTIPVSLHDPIYAFYTSGSTGRPKGALNKHLGIANRFLYMKRCYDPGTDDVVLLTSNYVFDASVWQLLWPATLGIKTVIPADNDLFDLQGTARLIASEKVTITHFVPSVLNVLVDMLTRQPSLCEGLTSLRHIQVGGEQMNAKQAYKLKSLLPGLQVTNSYGPTETSISTMFYTLPEKETGNIPIGRPMDNVKVLIMDAHNRPVAKGVTGELWLGGHCVGLGYLNRPALTAKAFITSPLPEFEGETFYRTGDYVRLREDGNVEFLGRIDHQVKIRGHRIELKEIEAVMMQHPAVRQAVVVVWEEEGQGKLLSAYYCGEETGTAAITEFLRHKLADYMVPASIQWLERMPLTTAGKINRAGLPRPIAEAERRYEEPANETETTLMSIWEDVLQNRGFGVADNFFALGGHSLSVVQVQSRIVQVLGINVSIKELFMLPTIRLLAERLSEIMPRPEEEILEILIDEN